MPVSTPLPFEMPEFLPFVCLDLCELPLLSYTAIWACDALVAQDEMCPWGVALQICSAGSKTIFACP